MNMKQAYLINVKRVEVMWYWRGYERWREEKIKRNAPNIPKGFAKGCRTKTKEEAIEKLTANQPPPITLLPRFRTASRVDPRTFQPERHITSKKEDLTGNSGEAFWQRNGPVANGDENWRPRNRNVPAMFEIIQRYEAEEESPSVRSVKKRKL
jgi:hypothetical protein